MAMETIREMGRKAREASRAMATATPAAKTEFLYALARLLMDRRKEIIEVNKKDVEEAVRLGLDAPPSGQAHPDPGHRGRHAQSLHPGSGYA